MAYETLLAGAVPTLLAIVAMACAVRSARRSRRLEAELEGLLDNAWNAEDRAASAATSRDATVATSRFLATVTHEMRTPLSGVIGTASLLLDTPLAPDQRTYARAILGSAEAMLALVDDMLDLSRLDADRLALQPAPFAVRSLVEDVAELLAPRAHAKGLDIAALVARDAPQEITADAARVRQILLNLAGNAVKFTSVGGVGIRVDREGDVVRFRVVDSGPGFDPQDGERIFREFERGEKAVAAGAGLGLPISRRLAEAMGGSLQGWPSSGGGATFDLTLPAGAAADADEAPAPLAGLDVEVMSSSRFSGPWMVEDLVAAGANASLNGSEADGSAPTAETGAAEGKVVIVDIASGGGLAQRAAAARAAGARRVLLLLAPSERGELVGLAEAGFDGYLVKPVRSASLIHQIRAEDRPAAPAEAPTPGVAFPTGTGLKVLVAEDDPVSALIALAHLTRLGHASVHVADGLAACEAFERGDFDAALIDVRMPLLDGCAVARRMRQFEMAQGDRRALIVALTANAEALDREAALGAGMDDVMAKPLDRHALEAVLAPLAARATASSAAAGREIA